VRILVRPILLAVFFALSVHAQPKLAFDRIGLHQFEDGPALAPDYEFVPGETVYFSCRITGYQVAKAGDQQSVKLAWQMRILDPAGVPLEKDKAGRVEDTVLPQDKEWKPKVAASFIMPGFVPTGIYRVSVKLKDEVAEKEINSDLNFHVRGHEVEPSAVLIARNFQFLRAEDDRTPMRPPVYHPGETLWARFDITGFKFGENNHFSVAYGLAILNAAGEQLFAQPEAAADEKNSFYPQRYVPGVLSLNLDRNVAKAGYTLVLSIHDKVGNQTLEIKQPFQVE
jgi:hypothetical protein